MDNVTIEPIGFYDKEEIIENCTVQILTNTETGEQSVGWWRGTKADMPHLRGSKEIEGSGADSHATADIPNLDEMPCAGFLEDFVRELYERDPDPQCIGVCVRLSDGKVLTGYYHANTDDMALFAHHMHSDAMFEELEASAGWLKDVLADVEDEEDEDEDEDEEGESSSDDN